MTTHTIARRICRSLNRHARSPRARTASGGGINVYFDDAGHEVYTAEAWEFSRRGPFEDVCPFSYETVLIARPHQLWTIAEVEQELEA